MSRLSRENDKILTFWERWTEDSSRVTNVVQRVTVDGVSVQLSAVIHAAGLEFRKAKLREAKERFGQDDEA